MKKIIISAAILSLFGCGTTDSYKQYVDSHEKIMVEKYRTETAKYAALKEIANSGSDVARVAAVMSINNLRSSEDSVPQLQAPKSASDTALQWASILVPTLANVGVQAYTVRQQTDLARRQSDNQVSVSNRQSDNAVLSTNSTNAAFMGIAAGGVNSAVTISGNSLRSLDKASDNTTLAAVSSHTSLQNISNAGFSTTKDITSINASVVSGIIKDTTSADTIKTLAGYSTASTLGTAGLTATALTSANGLNATTTTATNGLVANVTTAQNGFTTTGTVAQQGYVSTSATALAGLNASSINSSAGLNAATTIAAASQANNIAFANAMSAMNATGVNAVSNVASTGINANSSVATSGLNSIGNVSIQGMSMAQYISNLIKQPITITYNLAEPPK